MGLRYAGRSALLRKEGRTETQIQEVAETLKPECTMCAVPSPGSM